MGRGFGPEDEYGVPIVIFGVHHPDFFPLLGRAIALSSVIERDVITLARKLVVLERCNVATSRRSEVLKAAKSGLDAISNVVDRKQVANYLSDVESGLITRDAYAHGLFPASSLEHGKQVVGWRTKPGAPDLEFGEDLIELREDVLRFSELVMRWNNKILPMVSQLQWLQAVGEAL